MSVAGPFASQAFSTQGFGQANPFATSSSMSVQGFTEGLPPAMQSAKMEANTSGYNGALPPLPNVQVPPPSWALFSGTMHHVPGIPHDDPRVMSIPRAVVAAPNTAQYGGPWPRGLENMDMPTPDVKYSSWGQSQVNNVVDHAFDTIADKAHNAADPEYPWYWIDLDGWQLQFWPKEYDPMALVAKRLMPTATIDIRTVHRTEVYEPLSFTHGGQNPMLNNISDLGGRIRAERMGITKQKPHFQDPWQRYMYEEMSKPRVCKLEISLIMQTGVFRFYVRTMDEAKRWCHVINNAKGQQALFVQRHREEALENARLLRAAHEGNHKLVMDADKGMSGTFEAIMKHDIPTEREHALKRVWTSIVKSYAMGMKPPDTKYEELYFLYDVDSDHSLSLTEIEVMIKELLSVRRKECEKAMNRHAHESMDPKQLLTDCKEEVEEHWGHVDRLGNRLLSDYKRLMEGGGFEYRCSIIHAELDLSCDGFVDLQEFIAGCPTLILPEPEMRTEATFYKTCEKAIKRSRRAERWARRAAGEDDGDEEESCVTT